MKRLLEDRLKGMRDTTGWILRLEITPPVKGDKSRGPLPLYRIVRRVEGKGGEVREEAMTPSYTGPYLYDWMGAYLQGFKDAVNNLD